MMTSLAIDKYNHTSMIGFLVTNHETTERVLGNDFDETDLEPSDYLIYRILPKEQGESLV